jgi:hypothetical protein
MQAITDLEIIIAQAHSLQEALDHMIGLLFRMIIYGDELRERNRH